MKHGGSRSNAGRKKINKKTGTISFRVEEITLTQIEVLQEFYRKNKTSLTQKVVEFLKIEFDKIQDYSFAEEVKKAAYDSSLTE